MIRFYTLILIGPLLGSVALKAQSPFSAETKKNYSDMKSALTKAADEMPEANYSFKASPPERTYGELVGHVADVQLAICGAAKGEQKKGDAGTKTSKADLTAALKASFDYCDSIYDAVTDADGASKVKMFGREVTKLGALNFNVIHDSEMYGQMAVYLRIKELVPPTSQRRP